MGAALPELKYSEAALEVGLSSSRRAAWVVVCVTLATLGLIAATPGAAALRILAATWIACAGLEALNTLALRRGARAVRSLLVQRSGAIEVAMVEGGYRTGIVRDGSFVAPWLTIIHWRPAGCRFDRTIVVLPDMLAPDDFRRLRVLLRWAA